MLAPRALAATLLLLAPVFLVTHPASAVDPISGEWESFDGTMLSFTLFLPQNASEQTPVPVVLRTHGWAGSRETSLNPTTQAMINANYAVLTWDSRGFGTSSGKVQLNSPDYEVKDVRSLLDMLQARNDIAEDATGVLAAMSGGSYAGGIQLLTSAYDARVRAIAPEITWNSLPASLAPSSVVKNQWVQLLFWGGLATSTAGGAQLGRFDGYDTNLPTYYAEAMATNGPTPDMIAALDYRSPATHASNLLAPALLMNGWSDSLFTANEAIANFEAIQANGVDAKLLLFCGGHSGCPYNATGQRAHMDAAIVSWFDKHVKGAAVDTGAPVEWFDSANVHHSASAWPIPGTTMASALGHGVVVAQPAPLSGGVANQASSSRASSDPLTSFRVPIDVPDGAQITGIPRVVAGIPCNFVECEHPLDVTLFFRLVDVEANSVIDGLSTPLRFGYEAGGQTDLAAVSYQMPPGHHLALEVSTNDAAFLASRVPGVYGIAVWVDVPVVQ